MARNSIIDITFPFHLIHCIKLTDKLITAHKNWYRIIKTAQETTNTDEYIIFFSSKPLAKWIGIQ